MESFVVLPIALGLAAAFFFAGSNVLIRAGIDDSTPIVALAYSLTANVVVLWPVTLLVYDVQFDLWAWRWFIVAGTLAPVLGRFFNYTGIDKLGLNISTPIVYTNPLVAVALATIFLDQRLSIYGYLGGVLVVAGGISLAMATVDDQGFDFEPRHLIFPVLAATFYGGSYLFREIGIEAVPRPVLAAVVTISASWLWLMVYLLATGGGEVLSVRRREATFFTLAGLATGIAIPLLYAALRLGAVSIVAPLTDTTPFWVLVFSFVFFREDELFSREVYVGTALAVSGVILLSAFGTA